MSEPYLSQIQIYAFNFPPRGWATCDGQLLPINQNQSLYSLVGTMYGGDGRTTFGLPDLRGRAALHIDSSHPEGQKGGAETVAITSAQMPKHRHGVWGGASADGAEAADMVPGKGEVNVYGSAGAGGPAMRTGIVTNNAPAGQGHPNMQPSLVLNFCIATTGLFPPRN